jgi:hypothetical protein
LWDNYPPKQRNAFCGLKNNVKSKHTYKSMEKITIYIAVDGTRFDRKADCEYYESIYKNVSNIMARLRPNEDVSSCIAIRQDIDVVREVKQDFFLICVLNLCRGDSFF